MSAPLVDLLMRPAVPDDAARLAEVHLAARRAAPMPAPVHSDAEVHAWVASRLAPPSGEDADEVWVAERDGVVVGYARMTSTWLDDLYVLPSAAGQGVGSALLDLAKSLHPAGFSLWVFETNLPARAFYARHGFVEVLRTDGADNEEKEPDIQLAWRPAGEAGRS